LTEQRNNATDQAIDSALRRRLSPPDDETLAQIVNDAVARATAAPPPVAGVIGRTRLWAVAAAIVGMIVGGWLFWQAVAPRPSNPYDQPWRSVAQVYDDTVQDFAPQWVCRDDAEFARSFADQLGQPLLLAQSGGVQALGLSVCNTLSPRTLVLLARADGQEVLVLVDRIERDRTITLPPESSLKLFRRQIGDLVLYELTPREQPAVIEHFYQRNAS
jgi:hypothetical protein